MGAHVPGSPEGSGRNGETMRQLVYILTDTQSHIIRGNRMRSQAEKRRRVAYDDRWFYKQEGMLPAVLFPQIMRYNSRQVYRNLRDQIWNT